MNYIGSLICLEGISCSYVNGKIFCTSSCALKVLLLLLLFDVPAVPVTSFPFRKDSKLWLFIMGIYTFRLINIILTLCDDANNIKTLNIERV